MKLIVNPHKIEIEKSPVNEKEINITKVEFEFTDEITNDYVKEAYFTLGGNSYKKIIQNNGCDIPSEVLNKQGQVEIGVVVFLVENEETIKRYNPSPVYINTLAGSLKNASNSEPITPSEMEQFEQQLQNGLNELEEAIESIEVDTTYAREMGDYAKEQGNYSKEQGENAQELVETYTNTLTAMQTDISTNTTNINTNTNNITNLNTRMGTTETNISTINTNLANYSLITETGSQLALSLDSTNYKITALLKDKNGNTIYTSNEIDLPVESVVVDGRYDNTTKEVILTLENGSTIRFSVADLVSGLQSEITSANKLSSDLVDDSNSTNKFVTSVEKTAWNNKSDFNGNYNDLTNKPTIPTQLSELSDDSTHRLVSDTEKATWNSKLDNSALNNYYTKSEVDTTLQNYVTDSNLATELTPYVKNTDYASSSKGGVIKTNSTYATNIFANGDLYAEEKTYAQYETLGKKAFISKQTLENVLTARIGDINSVLDAINGEVI